MQDELGALRGWRRGLKEKEGGWSAGERAPEEDVIISEASPGELSQESFALPPSTLLSNNRAASFARCWKAVPPDFSFVFRSSLLPLVLLFSGNRAPIVVGSFLLILKLNQDTDF